MFDKQSGGGSSGSGGMGDMGGMGALSGAMGMFKQIDQNGDGKITEEDFVLLIQQFGLGSAGEQFARIAFKQGNYFISSPLFV